MPEHVAATLRAEDLWRRLDDQLFGGRLRRHPVRIVFGPPRPGAACLGAFVARTASWSPVVHLDERLLVGWPEPLSGAAPAGRWALIRDVIAHEACHAVVHFAGRPLQELRSHDGAFAAVARHAGHQLGLPPVPGHWAAWPFAARPGGYYLDPARTLGR